MQARRNILNSIGDKPKYMVGILAPWLEYDNNVFARSLDPSAGHYLYFNLVQGHRHRKYLNFPEKTAFSLWSCHTGIFWS